MSKLVMKPNFRIATVFSFIIQGLVLYLVAPLQVDPHHDGIILGAAISFSEGGTPHHDAFSQYGPVSPIIQGLFLRFTQNSMLSLRYFTALICLSISTVLFLLMKKIASNRLALSISNLWVFTSAIWATTFPGALLPWPSLISTLFLVIALFLLIVDHQSITRISPKYFVAGALISIAGFTRGQSWIVIGLLAILLFLNPKSTLKNFFYLVIGYLSIIIAFAFYLGRNSAIIDFVNQVWIWPLTVYPSLGQGNNYNRFQMILYAIESVVFLALVATAVSGARKIQKTFLTLILVSITSLGIALTGQLVSKLSGVPTVPRVLVGEPLEKILISPFFFSTLITCLILVSALTRRVRKLFKLRESDWVLLVFSLTGVIQLYPQSDSLHLWWIAPLCLPVLTIAIRISFKQMSITELEFSRFVLLPISISGLILCAHFINQPWKEYTLPVLQGTYADPRKVDSLEMFTQIAAKSIKGQTSFDCADGVYAVANGTYNAPDAWFVNWGNSKNENTKIGRKRFICNQSIQYAQNEAKRLRMKLQAFYSGTKDEHTLAILTTK